jgi:predicted RNase H-like HicB family nuclease
MVYVGILDGKGDVWGVRIPDVPGVHGGGATPQAAIADAASALSEAADLAARSGRRLPKPRSVDVIRADSAVLSDLSEADVFVLVEAKIARATALSEA